MKNSNINLGDIEKIVPQSIPVEQWSENGQFQNFDIDKEQIKNLQKNNISYLFPIQAHTFKPIFSGRDLIGKDRTGSGKTLAFSLPLIVQKRKQKKFQNKNGQKPLILAILPTRELAIQVEKQFFDLKLNDDEYRTLVIYGGTKYDFQESSLKQGVEIVVGTPGRLKDLLNKQTLSLENLEAIILDETDELLKMGFQQDIEDIVGQAPLSFKKKGQFLMFSATVPKWVVNSSQQYMKDDRIFVDMVNSSENQSSKTITHCYIEVNNINEKFQCIPNIIKKYTKDNRTIIFSNTKKTIEDIAQKIQGFNVGILSGDVRQYQRERVMKQFKEKDIPIIIATDVAARGIHVNDLDLIIQFSPPTNCEQYIHRSGRTGRAGKKGFCVTLIDDNEYKDIQKIKQQYLVKFEKLQKYKFLKEIQNDYTDSFEQKSQSKNYEDNQKQSNSSWEKDNKKYSNKNNKYSKQNKWDRNNRYNPKEDYQKNSYKDKSKYSKNWNNNKYNNDSEDDEYDSNKVYIGNLPYNAQEDDLKELLQKKNLNVNDIFFVKKDGEFRGSSFVTFDQKKDMKKALDMSFKLEGRYLKINKAKKKKKFQIVLLSIKVKKFIYFFEKFEFLFYTLLKNNFYSSSFIFENDTFQQLSIVILFKSFSVIKCEF